jgi:hypothetical protein
MLTSCIEQVLATRSWLHEGANVMGAALIPVTLGLGRTIVATGGQ